MSQRFFVEPPITGSECRLEGPEAHHLTRVMRAAVGDEVQLFDGSGTEFTGRIARIAKDSVDLAIVGQRSVNRELPFALTLAVALPKGDRQKLLIEKLVELGVTTLIPLVTERGVAQPVDSALERLQRGVIEASKQCGRNRLLRVVEPRDVLSLVTHTTGTALRMVAHLRGEPLTDVHVAAADIVFAVGPEGGFADEEISVFDKAGWDRIALGPRILRIETAAIALAAWAGLR